MAHGGAVGLGQWHQPPPARPAGPAGTNPAQAPPAHGADPQRVPVALRIGAGMHPVRTAGH